MNFDEMSALYQNNPEEFHIQTRREIEKLINSIPPERRERAKQLQRAIDATMDGNSDPIDRLNVMLDMLWTSVYDLAQITSDPFGYMDRLKKETTIKRR